MMTCRALVLTALLVPLAAGCGGGSRQATTTPSKNERLVSGVGIRGNQVLAADDILGGLSTRGPSGRVTTTRYRFDPLQAELDRKRIESYYEGRGFFSARVTDIELRPFDDAMAGPLVYVEFVVREGPRTTIATVSTNGAPEELRTEIARVLSGAKLQAGEPIVYEHYSVAKTRLQALLVRRGYAFARVEGKIEVERRLATAAVTLEIEAGPLARFGRVTVLGLRDIPESAVRTRVAWTAGEVFDSTLIEATRARLFAMGAFSIIRIDHERTHAGDRADVTIRLTETYRREVKFGGGVGVDRAHYEIRGRAAHVRRGFLHPLMTLRLDLRPAVVFLRGVSGTGQLAGEATAAGDLRDVLYPRALLTTELSYLVSSLDAYSMQGPRLRIAAQRPFLADRLHLSFGWQLALRTFFRIDDAITEADRSRLSLVSPYRLGLFEQTISYDGRDDPVNPRAGYYAEVRLEQAGTFAGSAFGYVRAVPEVRGFVPLSSRLVAAARVRFGWLLSGALPITQRFFAGGASSQRGFSQQRLAPFVVGDEDRHVPVGGETLLETSAELRADVTRLWGNWLGVVGFLDGAEVTDSLDQLDVQHLHWAAGGGLRYRTPIGALRLDLGFRLGRTGAGEPDPDDTWAFHFSLGEAF
ncbi:MAG TPA: BamA/TamA family outer membrane protein [Kofleriaceae bacterium]|nr:BamA/TamA family outer membrane protein [Kofleriaceae bacterium]